MILIRTVDRRNAGYRVTAEMYAGARRTFAEDPANRGKNPEDHIYPVGSFIQSFDSQNRKVQEDVHVVHRYDERAIQHAVKRALRYLRTRRLVADAPSHIKLALGVLHAVREQASA